MDENTECFTTWIDGSYLSLLLSWWSTTKKYIKIIEYRQMLYVATNSFDFRSSRTERSSSD